MAGHRNHLNRGFSFAPGFSQVTRGARAGTAASAASPWPEKVMRLGVPKIGPRKAPEGSASQTHQLNSDRHNLFPESQRDSVSQPRVAPTAPPWVTAPGGKQPQRGCGPSGDGRYPGHNPVGVEETTRRIPRVGAERQPWAWSHNTFGIATPVTPLLCQMLVTCSEGWRTPRCFLSFQRTTRHRQIVF
jgi:hypothetical protein